jgi:hypothetical protein
VLGISTHKEETAEASKKLEERASEQPEKKDEDQEKPAEH